MSEDISVIIPTCNRPTRLRDCLDCLASQQFDGSFETVVVDDGSDDPDAVEEVVHRSGLDDISLLRFPTPGGPATARNRGAEHATGDLLLFTDDDTLPDEQWLEEISGAAADHDFVEGCVLPTGDSFSPYERVVSNETGGEFLTANVAVRREVFDDIGGFDTSYREPFREDTDFGFKNRREGVAVTFAEDAVVYHPAYEQSWSDIVVDNWKFRYDPLLYSRFPEQYCDSIVYPLERFTPAYVAVLFGSLVSPLFACLLPVVGAAEMREYGYSGGLWTTLTYALARLFGSIVLVCAVLVGCYNFRVSVVEMFDPRRVTELV